MCPYSYQQFSSAVAFSTTQHCQSWESLNTPPNMTGEHHSVSPSTVSPVTPTSSNGSKTALSAANQASRNEAGFIQIPESNSTQPGYRQQYGYDLYSDLGSPATFCSSGASYHAAAAPGYPPVYEGPQNLNSHQILLDSHAVLSPQQDMSQMTHHYPPQNANYGVLGVNYDPHIRHNSGSNVWSGHGEANSGETYGGQPFFLNGDGYSSTRIQPTSVDNTQAPPLHPSPISSGASYVGSSLAYGSPSMNMGSISPVDSDSNLDTAQTFLPVKCKDCELCFTGKFGPGNLKRHAKLVHDSSRKVHFRCYSCEKSYKRADALKKHNWKIHRYPEAKPKKRKIRLVSKDD